MNGARAEVLYAHPKCKLKSPLPLDVQRQWNINLVVNYAKLVVHKNRQVQSTLMPLHMDEWHMVEC